MIRFYAGILISFMFLICTEQVDGTSLLTIKHWRTNLAPTLEDKSKTTLYYMNKICELPVMVLNLTDRNAVRIAPWNTSYPPPTTTCTMGVNSFAYQNFRLVLTFKKVKMTSAESTGRCVKSRLELFSATTSPRNQLTGSEGICGEKAPKEEYTTKKNVILLKYSTQNLTKHSYEFFDAVVTPFHTGKCQKDEFLCKNKRCIVKPLTCDGYNNCGDDSDEASCSKPASNLALPIPAIIGIAVGCAAIIAIITTIIACRFCCGRCSYEKLA